MPKEQIHKRFTTEQVKIILDWYEHGGLKAEEAAERLGCKISRFYILLRRYRQNAKGFNIAYPEKQGHNQISKQLIGSIRTELGKGKELIENRDIPVNSYNYAAIRDEVCRKTSQIVSAETVRQRAIDWGYTCPKPPKKIHDREVITTAPGILLQHDSSHHLWAPLAEEKWSLITTIDDFSRYLLFADFFQPETAFAHIQAAEAVILKYGTGLAYYTDSLRTFRFVCHQDSRWQVQVKGTDEALSQWQKTITACGMQSWHALSAEAKGKIERPYRWLQDRVVRRCAKDGIKDIDQGRMILQDDVEQYNEKRIHSTTKEIPGVRLRKALDAGNHAFRPFRLLSPYTSTKDIFCLRDQRQVDGYQQIHWRRYKISVPRNIPEGSTIALHIIPEGQFPEVRLWHNNKLIKVVRFR